MRISKFIGLAIVCILCSATSVVKAQNVVLKNNIAYDAIKTPNLSVEFGLSPKWTLDTQVGANFFFYKKDATSSNYKTTKWSHWLVQPEFRYWTCERFNGWFLGAHAHGGMINIGGIDLHHFILDSGAKDMKHYRYEGYFYGAGVSAGYHWVLGKRFNLEASLGLGFARIHYDKFRCKSCGEKIGKGNATYLGPTKVALSLVYVLK